MSKPLLTLSTLVERPVVEIDGAAYEMIVPDDVSLLELARMQRMQAKVQAISAKVESTEADVAAMAEQLEQLVAMILPELPGDVLARLSDVKRMAIISAFVDTVGAKAGTLPSLTSRPTGANSSPASSASTGELPATG